MSRVCDISGKRPVSGQSRSHSNRATKRRFIPNVQKKRIFDKKAGRWVRIKIATSVIRTMTKDERRAKRLIAEELKKDE